MKRIISLLLSFALLLTMTAGLNLTIYGAEVESVDLYLADGNIEFYDGWHGYTETDADGDFYYYVVEPYDLLGEGNTLNVTLSDSTQMLFECVREYRNDEEFDLVFKCGNTVLDLDDEENIYVDAEQTYNTAWEIGGTYTATLWLYGASADFSVTIVENPVDDVQITWDRPILIPENGHGHWMDEDDPENKWFMYIPNYMYLNYAGLRLDVYYTNGDHSEYFYSDNNWLPTDANGNELDGDYLEFGFNQMENHLYAGVQNRTAIVYYYGKGTESLPLEVVSGDIDEGSISEGEHRKILFCGTENHNISFTPSEDGVYIFEESLAGKLVWETNRFTGELYDEDGNIVNSLTNEQLAYQLEGGKTYTLQARIVGDDCCIWEFLSVRNINTAVGISFTPNWSDYSFYDGNLATDDALYTFGNQLTVTFSDGETKTFTCNGRRRYVDLGENGDNYDGIELRDYANSKGVDFDCNPYSNIDAQYWDANSEDNFIDIYVGTAHQRFFVNDYIQASPYNAISFNGTPVQVFYGTAQRDRRPNSQGEWVDYQRYDVNRWDLEKEGNSVTVTLPDNSEKTYTCTDNEGLISFVAPDGDSFMADELIVRENQGPENEWQQGETYTFDVFFRGQRCDFTAEVVASPVDYINIDTNGNIEVFENCNGHWQYDDRNNTDYFRYDEMYDYLRSVDAVITVHFSDGNEKVYDYHNQDWLPCDENDEQINQRYFEFWFDQDDDVHFERGAQNKAYFKYYGYTCELDVNVVQWHDVDNGELTTESRKTLFFLDGEEHYVTFTPERTGVYEFRNSLADRVRDGEFEFTVTNSGGDEINRVQSNDDNIFYNLTADEEYTITVRRNNNNCGIEYLEAELRTSVKKIEYSHEGGTIHVAEGDIGNGREIYDDGSTITVTFSDGTVETFTADRGQFRCGDGRQLHDFANDLGVYIDCFPRITSSTGSWASGTSAYYTLTVGNVSKKIYVTVDSSSVEAIVYHSKKPSEMVKGVDFEYDNQDDYLRINMDPFFEGDTVDIVYTDERGTVTYRYDRDNVFFVDTQNGREEIFLGYTFNDTHDYEIGDTIAFEIAYQTGRYTLNSTVVDNDVDRIEFTPSYPYFVFSESNGWWEHRHYYDEGRNEEVDEDFFHYNNPSVHINGNAITVYYKDGTSAEFVYNGRFFMDENGNRLDNRYIRTEDDQWNTHWFAGDDNEFYAVYKNVPAPVAVNVIDRGEWQLGARVIDSRGNIYEDGDTLYLEKGQRVFLYFDSDPRNREHGVADIIGFSDGYEDGTLTQRGFDVQTGNDFNFGYNFGDEYGLLVGTNNLRVGTTAQLYYYLYEFDGDDYNNFDFVNTPHAADFTLNIQIADHCFEASNTVPATCTEKGYTEYTCALCGITYRGDFTDYAAHSFEQTVIPANPNARGYTHYSCQHCDYEFTGDYTDYDSDATALVAVIQRSHYYSNSVLPAQDIQLIINEADGYQELAQTNAPQDEYDYAIGEILTTINSVDPMAAYSPTAIDNDTVTLANTAGDETEVSFIESINTYSAPLDVDKNGIVNIRDYSIIVKTR